VAAGGDKIEDFHHSLGALGRPALDGGEGTFVRGTHVFPILALADHL
jgi:hypothetical protein